MGMRVRRAAVVWGAVGGLSWGAMLGGASVSLVPPVHAAARVRASPAAAAGAPDYAKERAESAKELTEPYGWFSLVALGWMKPGVTTVGSAKGSSVEPRGVRAHLVTLEQRDGRVTIKDAAPGVMLGGRAAAAGMEVGADERDGSALRSGTVRMWAIDRGGQRYLRVKDSEAPALKGFHGLRWYAPDARYRVEARWVPYPTPHTMKVMNKLGQITPVPAPGYVEFAMDGKTLRLTPMSASEKGLFFVFRDATYRQTTDGGGRFLETAAPSNGLTKEGTVVLDFNEATNPPCAYSPYATCPLASPENRLEVAVEAGEKRYE